MPKTKRKPTKEELQKKIEKVEKRKPKKRPPNYHNTHTFIIECEHCGSDNGDDTPFEQYVRIVDSKLREVGVKGGIRNWDSVKVCPGVHGNTSGIFLDLPTKETRLFFPNANLEGVRRLVSYLITRR